MFSVKSRCISREILTTRVCHYTVWSKLGTFASDKTQKEGWDKLKKTAMEVEEVTEKGSRDTVQKIDWDHWEKSISHKDIVKSMRGFFESQNKILSHLLATEKDKPTEGWQYYDQALKSCNQSVKNAENLLNNGAKALWISANNPPLSKLDNNEWLDSDQYWQAFVEKHHFYSQYQPAVADPEDKSIVEANKASWHKRVDKFNDRSDTPMLYDNMLQLPSWEFYDINRRVFFEHMCYYLTRTGEDHRLFPEMPPWKWLAHIEDLRYKYISVAQRRRHHFQLEDLSREKNLDYLPVDVDHHGEEETMKKLSLENDLYLLFVSRLMGSYSFLCFPYIPIHSKLAFFLALKHDNAQGQIFSLGEDVNALFYLPHPDFRQLPRPSEGLYQLLNHMVMTGRRFNPGYTALLEIFTDVLETRGEHWVCAPGESVAESFIRRLRTDDPRYEVYVQYVEEMFDRFSKKEELKDISEINKRLTTIEANQKQELQMYSYLLESTITAGAGEAKENAEMLKKAYEMDELEGLIENKKIMIIDEINNKHIKDAKELFQNMKEFEKRKEEAAEVVKSLK